MAVLGVDLGGTKLSLAVFSEDGRMLRKEAIALDHREGKEVGQLIIHEIEKILISQDENEYVQSIGIAVPGISRHKTGTVWAPNIPGWEDYPLLEEVQQFTRQIPVVIDSDRACYISGELWKGNAQGCNDAIFLAIGTGIGAGILINGNILHGSHGISGAVGWMALDRPFDEKYISCGCFEYNASGEGIAKVSREFLLKSPGYGGELRKKLPAEINAHDVFLAYEKNDVVAKAVIEHCIGFWGMAVANLVSLFNPEKIILGGGVFGPANQFISAIHGEAGKWAQPISMGQVELVSSKLGSDAGLYGAGFLALREVNLV
jgi:glucokinase